MKTKNCGNCRWSRWVLTRKGSIKWFTCGVCTFEVKMPEVPSCQRALFNDRTAIQPKDGQFCPCHKPGLKPQAKAETEF